MNSISLDLQNVVTLITWLHITIVCKIKFAPWRKRIFRILEGKLHFLSLLMKCFFLPLFFFFFQRYNTFCYIFQNACKKLNVVHVAYRMLHIVWYNDTERQKKAFFSTHRLLYNSIIRFIFEIISILPFATDLISCVL